MREFNEKSILKGFGEGIVCSQAVFGEYAARHGFDTDTAMKISAAFGGGMRTGDTCGCVTGALMAIGLKMGQGEKCDLGKKAEMLEKAALFKEKFAKRFGSVICREMLGADVSKPEDAKKIAEENLFEKVCAPAVIYAEELLDEILG